MLHIVASHDWILISMWPVSLWALHCYDIIHIYSQNQYTEKTFEIELFLFMDCLSFESLIFNMEIMKVSCKMVCHDPRRKRSNVGSSMCVEFFITEICVCALVNYSFLCPQEISIRRDLYILVVETGSSSSFSHPLSFRPVNCQRAILSCSTELPALVGGGLHVKPSQTELCWSSLLNSLLDSWIRPGRGPIHNQLLNSWFEEFQTFSEKGLNSHDWISDM